MAMSLGRFVALAALGVLVLLSMAAVTIRTPDHHSFADRHLSHLSRRDILLALRQEGGDTQSGEKEASSSVSRFTPISDSKSSSSISVSGTKQADVSSTSSSASSTSSSFSSSRPTSSSSSVEDSSSSESSTDTSSTVSSESTSTSSSPSSTSTRTSTITRTSTSSAATSGLILVTSAPPPARASITDPTPATTLELATDPLTVASTFSSSLYSMSASATPGEVGAASNSGFLSNTPAVAGTFTVVGLLILAAFVGIVILVMKRRRSSRGYVDDDATFGVYRPDSGFVSHPESASSYPSMSENRHITLDANTNEYYEDPFYATPPSHSGHSHEVHQQQQQQHQDPFQDGNNHAYTDYGYGATAASNTPTPPQDARATTTTNNPFSDAYSATPPQQHAPRALTSSSNKPYHSNPANAGFLRPDVAAHETSARNSYQPSIDSFYGAGNVNTGYAT